MKKLLLSISLIASTILTNAQTVTNFAGNLYNGYSGDGGPATSAKFSKVGGMAFDQSGNMFFSDVFNNVIRKVNTSGIISTVIGTGTLGSAGDGGPAISAQLNNPENIVFDAVGNLYIKEPQNGKIRKVDVNGNISTYATIEVSSNRARAMAIDLAGNLFVNNDNSVTVKKISTSGVTSIYAGMVGTQGGLGDGGPAIAAELWQAYYLTTDVSGNLYIAEYQANTIRKVNTSGVISRFAGVYLSSSTAGYGGSVGDGGAATSAYLAASKGMAVNSAGELFVATDYGKIRFINSAGIINTVSIPAGFEINQPELLAFDSNNNLYVSDGQVIKKISNIQIQVGLKDMNSDKINFSLYPNPTSIILNIELDSETIAASTSVSITNILGEEVLKTTETTNKFTLKTNYLKSGVYFLTLANTGKTATKKIVIE